MNKVKDSGSIDSVVQTFIESAKAQMASISTGVCLALAELRVVVSHAGLIICLVIVAAGMVVVAWGLLLVVGALLFMSLGLSAPLAVLCMFLINIIALAGVAFMIRHTLQHLSFKHTRKFLTPEGPELGYSGLS